MPNSHLFDADIIVVGGGILGASTAMQLKMTYPKLSIVLLEKESKIAQHQTGRNSGVIHAGVYYEPGSLKAEFCRQGAFDMMKFCNQNKIKYQNCGKLIVATNEDELAGLNKLKSRCDDNDIKHQWLDAEQLSIKEPAISGLAALKIETSSIVDYQQVTQTMIDNFVEWGGQYWLDCEIKQIQETEQNIELSTKQGRFKTKYLVCCAGLASDRLAKLAGLDPKCQIIPFKGEYYQLPEKHNQLVKHLIYPVPDAKLPFLGIHLTRMIDGSVTVGPNAVLSFKREGYGNVNFSWQDTSQMLKFAGFWKLLWRYLSAGATELKNSWVKSAYLKQVQKYCPSIVLSDLKPYPAGVRAQAVSEDGKLIHDFIFTSSKRSVHVINAPSPAATSSLPIGRHIIEQLKTLTEQQEDIDLVS
ncbi:L-2-hydroxyglutarate oxidase [Catenovulum sp. SM1970]|uniref:L-2-hydroxyglutarate oxidase n=1 Tax=Marinifaba aquimaris TaxID=2741323 RepID=UPI00157211AB|nr:L-2-hydroxyglutarate oxidase [Marinifaba aquimaris]NTS77834.1 L-2-hydroxyglutarate oxidase [Marinifaba aquimaris]